jgi:hypothetical protein
VDVSQFFPENIASYPVGFIVDCIRACRRRANRQAHTAAYNALLTYSVNADPKKAPSKTIADFLPYPQEEDERQINQGPFEASLSSAEFEEVVTVMKLGWLSGKLISSLANIEPRFAKRLGL